MVSQSHRLCISLLAGVAAWLALAAVLAALPAQASPVKVALYRGPGTAGKGPPNLLRLLNDGNRSSIREITPDEIRAGTLTNFGVVIFAGGSASKQAEAVGESGWEAVREFVGRGGGYIGICAGAYLATSGFSWGLHLINARTVSPKWQRGVGEVEIELTAPDRRLLGERAGAFHVHYANGPVVKPANKPELPGYETLACFRTELAKNSTPAGVMVDSPALFAAEFKRGRVLCISPHPEQTPGLEEIVQRAVAWVAAPHWRVPHSSPRAAE